MRLALEEEEVVELEETVRVCCAPARARLISPAARSHVTPRLHSGTLVKALGSDASPGGGPARPGLARGARGQRAAARPCLLLPGPQRRPGEREQVLSGRAGCTGTGLGRGAGMAGGMEALLSEGCSRP